MLLAWTGGLSRLKPDAGQLDTWIGTGEKDFSLLWSGVASTATSADFHAAVDGAGPTVSIYSITREDGSQTRIGGCTVADWGANAGAGVPDNPVDQSIFEFDDTAIIFNLDTTGIQTIRATSYTDAIYAHENYFATFGSGATIFGGFGTLGTCNDTLNAACDGYGNAGFTYGDDQGQIVYAGDTGGNNGSTGIDFRAWSVNSLEVFTVQDAVGVPAPASLLWLLGGLVLIARRRPATPAR